MKISKKQLKQIIKEELNNIREGHPFDYDPAYGGSGTIPGGKSETPDLFQMAEDLRKVADRFDSEKAVVLKQAAEILHMESGVFE
jgi:hypothetical protein